MHQLKMIWTIRLPVNKKENVVKMWSPPCCTRPCGMLFNLAQCWHTGTSGTVVLAPSPVSNLTNPLPQQSPLVEKKFSRRLSTLPPTVSISQESGSSADHSGETVLEVDLALNKIEVDLALNNKRKVSMSTEPRRRLSTTISGTRDRSPSPFRLSGRSRSPFRSGELEREEERGRLLSVGKQRRNSGATIYDRATSGATIYHGDHGVHGVQQQHTSRGKREQWARSVRAKTVSILGGASFDNIW